MSIESMMPSNRLILCGPHLHLSPIFPSIRVFNSESALLIRWPKYWSVSFNISLSSEYLGLISLYCKMSTTLSSSPRSPLQHPFPTPDSFLPTDLFSLKSQNHGTGRWVWQCWLLMSACWRCSPCSQPCLRRGSLRPPCFCRNLSVWTVWPAAVSRPLLYTSWK